MAITLSANRAEDVQTLLTHGNCETSAPTIVAQAGVKTVNATFTRSSEYVYGGAGSYKFIKTAAAGTVASVWHHDHTLATSADMAGLVAGLTYSYSMWLLVTTASGITPSEIELLIDDDTSGPTVHYPSAGFALSVWTHVEVQKTLGSGATGIQLGIRVTTTAAISEFFYVDELRLYSVGVDNEHSQAFSNPMNVAVSTDTNSWQSPFQT